MASDPKYVRLAVHLARGGRYDLNSGWSIAGYDVREMPDKETEPNSYRFVIGEVRAGRLEGASKAEFDEVHPDLAKELGFKVVTEGDDGAVPFQEGSVQREALKRHARIRARRDEESDEDAVDLDEKRRKAILERQREQTKRGGRKAGRRAAAEAEDDPDEADEVDESTEETPEVGFVEPEVEADGSDDGDGDDDDGDTYDEMSKNQLVAEARSRGLTIGGTAEELRERLRENDE